MPNYCSVGCYCLAEIFKNEVTIVELVTECLGFVGFGLFMLQVVLFFVWIILLIFRLITTCATVNCCEKK